MNEKCVECFREVLVKYGNSALIKEFQSLSDDGKVKVRMLTGLGTTIRDNLAASLQEKMTHTNGPLDSAQFSKKGADRSCPMYKALVEFGVNPEVLNEDLLKQQRRIISQWGQPLLPPYVMKMCFEQQAGLHAEMQKLEIQKGKLRFNNFQTSRSVVKQEEESSASIEWSKLQKIQISELKLFDTCKGCMLEGKLVVDPFTPMVGSTTLLQDSDGSIIKICLYNFLPAGAFGQEADEIAKTMIPKDSVMRVSEPFLKIFRDGTRGIRVDNPGDVQIINPRSTNGEIRGDREKLLRKAKDEGNKLFAKRWYHAASEIYLAGLRKDNLIPTLLSNRAQTSIKMNDWATALCDASASLTLRPDSEKTWDRYHKALRELGVKDTEKRLCHNIGKLRSVMLEVFTSASEISCNDDDSETEDNPEKIKADANEQYKLRNFEHAYRLYSRALCKSGGTTRAILSNWSQCALYLNTQHDAIAASAASLRIVPEDKSVYRLAKSLALIGEPSLSVAVLNKFQHQKTALFDELTSSVYMSSSDNFNIQTAIGLGNKLIGSWVGPIETYQTQSKGRGVRASEAIAKGDVVLVDRPIIERHIDLGDKNVKSFALTTSTGIKDIDDDSQALIKSASINRLQRDGSFARILNNLYDGKTVPPLVPFSDLLLNLTSAHPLLPSHHEYFPGDRIYINPKRVSGIIRKNSHGFGVERKQGGGLSVKDVHSKTTELFPGSSMFNHSRNANCTYTKLAHVHDYQVLVARRPVKKGEELTVQYHEDEDLVKRNWL